MRRRPDEAMKDIRVPTCMDCSSRFTHEGRSAIIQNNVSLQPFAKYCTARKRPKLICKSGVVGKLPSWCPKRKSPCDLRVYGFVNDEARRMQAFFSEIYGKASSPREDRYAMRFKGSIDLTPREFWRRCHESGENLKLPTEVRLYEVVEIDDGLRPVCFYRTERGFRIETLFKTEKVCQHTDHME